jgi:mRNA-degrading endonuclease YafQ of YafQ-DinJ toxin-antitoxin module
MHFTTLDTKMINSFKDCSGGFDWVLIYKLTCTMWAFKNIGKELQ